MKRSERVLIQRIFDEVPVNNSVGQENSIAGEQYRQIKNDLKSLATDITPHQLSSERLREAILRNRASSPTAFYRLWPVGLASAFLLGIGFAYLRNAIPSSPSESIRVVSTTDSPNRAVKTVFENMAEPSILKSNHGDTAIPKVASNDSTAASSIRSSKHTENRRTRHGHPKPVLVASNDRQATQSLTSNMLDTNLMATKAAVSPSFSSRNDTPETASDDTQEVVVLLLEPDSESGEGVTAAKEMESVSDVLIGS